MVKPKRCKQCGAEFVPMRSTAVACSYICAKLWVDARSEKLAKQRELIAKKIDRQLTKERKEALKTLRDWKKDAQTWVNKYVRMRDDALPCISCGRHHQGQYHAGHYLSRGAHPELSLELRNIHKQCAPCNNHLSGNQVKYRFGLIERYGVEYVEWLEGPHEPKKTTIDDCKAIIAEMKLLIKGLKNGNQE